MQRTCNDPGSGSTNQGLPLVQQMILSLNKSYDPSNPCHPLWVQLVPQTQVPLEWTGCHHHVQTLAWNLGANCIYASTACTGYILEWVQLTYRVWPVPKGSVLLECKVTDKRVGLVRLFTWTSLEARGTWSPLGTAVISPARKNPKNPRVVAAHSRLAQYRFGSAFQKWNSKSVYGNW